nr:hypothetical protein Y7A9C.3 - Caenorhabditis elegans [Caenorhabditis elegans]
MDLSKLINNNEFIEKMFQTATRGLILVFCITILLYLAIFPFYVYVFKLNRRRDNKTVLFPTVNHFFQMDTFPSHYDGSDSFYNVYIIPLHKEIVLYFIYSLNINSSRTRINFGLYSMIIVALFYALLFFSTTFYIPIMLSAQKMCSAQNCAVQKYIYWQTLTVFVCKSTLLFPTVSHFYEMVKFTFYLLVLLILCIPLLFVATHFSEIAVYLVICLAFFIILALYQFTETFHFIIFLLAAQRFLVFYFPSTEKHIALFQKFMSKKVWYVHLTLLFPTVGHVYNMVTITFYLFVSFIICMSLFMNSGPELSNLILFIIVALITFALYLSTEAFHFLIFLLAAQRFLVFYFPSTEKHIALFQKFMSKKVWYVHLVSVVKEITIICIVGSQMEIKRPNIRCIPAPGYCQDTWSGIGFYTVVWMTLLNFSITKIKLQGFILFFHVLLFLSIPFYIPIMISAQKISSNQYCKVQNYIHWQTLTIFVCKLVQHQF